VRAQTTASEWLKGGRIASIEGVMIEEVADHAEGLARVASGELTAYFADRAILLGQLGASDSKDDLTVSVAQFTHEPYALAVPLGDQELRLALDRALSYLYRNGLIYKVYERHFGKPGAEAALFYTMTAMPE
jgi:polar amino acid transport system substrate-binding protein/glutamate/aspartate transport system substrate-binding protein